MRYTPSVDLLAIARRLSTSSTSQESTEALWGNLGYWAGDDDDYAHAAEALAVALARHARIQSGQDLLEIGCGAGESLRLWARAFAPASLEACEPEPALAARAEQRLAALEPKPRILPLDAEAWASRPGPPADHVLALDCAYLIPGRHALLARVRERLRPGGHLTLCDLLVADRTDAAIPAHLASAFGIPRDNLLRREAYVAGLRNAGYGDIDVVDWTEPVLRGFATHVRRHARRLLRIDRASLAIGLTALACAWAARGRLAYVGIRARRG